MKLFVLYHRDDFYENAKSDISQEPLSIIDLLEKQG